MSDNGGVGDDSTTSTVVSLEPAKTKSSRRRRAAWIVGIIVVALIVIVVVVDFGLRAIVQNTVTTEIEDRLPSNVTGDVSVAAGGGSMIIQLLSGSLDDVTVRAPRLKVDGVPAKVQLRAKGVPLDMSKPVDHITGTISLGQDALNTLLKIPDATSGLVLGDGILSFDGTQKVLGVPVDYHVTAKPVAAGDTLLFTPTNATVIAGPANLKLTSVVNNLLGQKPLSVCVAQYLPPGIGVKSVSVTPKSASLTLDAKNVTFSEKVLNSKGTCD